jgi:hypothetical protein
MPKSTKSVEDQIQNALGAISNQEKPNIASVAREFGVPYQRLRARWKGRPSLSQRPPTHRKLDSSQEHALCSYIDYLDSLGLAPKRDQIAGAANSILQEHHDDPLTPPPKIGEHWLSRFLKRHPEYYRRRRRAVDIERQRAQDKTVIRRWFGSYIDTINQYGIASEDIYNFDETGFQIGIGRDQWIITREPRRKILSGTTTNRESITVIEAVSTNGFVIPPVIIFSARQVLLRWFNHLQHDERVAVTDSGYINDQLAYQWIQHFHKSTKDQTKGVYRLLICDRFGSHLTYEFVRFCEINRIILFFLPPHSSHILQPLDVGVFSVYKHYHSEAVEDATVTGCEKFTKDEFLSAIASIRSKTFKLSTIKLGFRLTGLWPINPSLVLDNLIAYDGDSDNHHYRTPSPPRSDSTQISTPKTADRFKRIEDRLNQLDKNSRAFQASLDKLMKGARAQAYLAEQLRFDLNQTTRARLAREARYNISRRYTRVSGIISSNQVMKMKRDEQKLGDLEALNRMRPQWKKVMRELKMYCRREGRFIR